MHRVARRTPRGSGWLRVEQLTIASFDTEDTLVVTGVTDDGHVLDHETCEKLLTLPARLGDEISPDDAVKDQIESALLSQVQRP